MNNPHLRSRRAIAVLSAICLAGLAAAGCSSGAKSSDDSRSIHLLTPLLSQLADPAQASGIGMGPILMAMEPLVRYESDGSLVPELASKVSTPDPLTYVYDIRTDVSFWDGSTLTAEDVAFSLNLHVGKDSTSINAPLFASVADVSVVDKDTVEVSLKDPDPQFSYAVAAVGMVSKAFYDEHGEDVGTPDVLNMGTGPYRITEFVPRKELTLEATDDYWGDAPEIDSITLSVIGDDAARLNGIQSGEYDGMLNVPLPQVDSMAGLDGIESTSSPDLSVYKFNLNVATPPWDDIHLRRAFALALNRDGIVEGALGGHAVEAPTLVPSEFMAALAGDDETGSAYEEMGRSWDQDLDTARSEMAQSSTPDGVSAEVLVTGSDPTLALVAQSAAQDLSEIGIDLTIKQVDDQTYYKSVYYEHLTDGVSLDLFSGSSPDASNLPLYILPGYNAATEGGPGFNISDYVNPAVDGLIADSQKLEVDDPERGAKLIGALQTAQDDVPYVPLAFPEVYHAARDDIDVSGLDTFWWLTRWPYAMAGSS